MIMRHFLVVIYVLILLQLCLVRGDDEFSEYGNIDDEYENIEDEYENIDDEYGNTDEEYGNIDDESSLKGTLFRNAFQPIPKTETTIDDDCQEQYPDWTKEIVDPTTDSFLYNNKNVANIIRRLEIKFDRIMELFDFEKDNRMQDMSDVMNTLNFIQSYIESYDDNVDRIEYSYKSRKSHTRPIIELMEEVNVINNKLRNVELNVDQVMTNIRTTMQSLEEVSYTIQNIDQRTIRIEEATHNQQVPNNIFNGNEIRGVNGNPFLSTVEKTQTSMKLSDKDFSVGHRNPHLTTNTNTQTSFNENDIVGSRNPSMGVKNRKNENQINEYDVSFGHEKPPLTTNTRTQFKEDNTVGKMNPSMSLKNTKTDVSVNHRKPQLTTNTNIRTRFNENDIVGSTNPSMNVKTKSENQLNDYDINFGHKKPPLTTHTRNQLKEDNTVGSMNPSMGFKKTDTENQLSRKDVTVGHRNPPLTANTNIRTRFNDNDIVGSTNPSMNVRTKSENQLNEFDVNFGHKKPPLTTNTRTQFKEDNTVGNMNPSIGLENTKTENQLSVNDASVSHKNPHLTTLIPNQRTQVNEDVKLSNINPSMGIKITKTETQSNENDINVANEKPRIITTNMRPQLNEDDTVGSINLSMNMDHKNTNTKYQLNENQGTVGSKSPRLATTTTNTRSQLNEGNIVGSINSSAGISEGKTNLTFIRTTTKSNGTRHSSEARIPYNITTPIKTQSKYQLSKNSTISGNSNPTLINSSMVRTPSNVTTTTKSQEGTVGSINMSMNIDLKNSKTKNQLKEHENGVNYKNPPLTTSTTNTRSQLNEGDIVDSINSSTGIIDGNSNLALITTTTKANGTRHSSDARTPSTTTDSQFKLIKNETIVGKANTKISGTTTTAGVNRNSSLTRNPSNNTTFTQSQFSKNVTIVGNNNRTVITTTINSDVNRNSSMAETAFNTTTTHKSQDDTVGSTNLSKNMNLKKTTTENQLNKNESSIDYNKPHLTTTTNTRSQLNKGDIVGSIYSSTGISEGKSNITLSPTTTKANGTNHSFEARIPSNITTTTKTQFQHLLSKNSTIAGNSKPIPINSSMATTSSNVTTTPNSQSKFNIIGKIFGKTNTTMSTTSTNVGVTRNSSMAKTTFNTTTNTESQFKLNDTIVGTRNETMINYSGGTRNSSIARTPSNITTTTKSQLQLSGNSSIVGERNPTLSTTTTSANTQKTTTLVSKRKYRDIKRSHEATATFKQFKTNCQDLEEKRNGIYKFGSQDELSNEAGRFFYERYCDFNTDDVAWTVIARRFAKDRKENFNRTWIDYKLGFGVLNREFWFGNDFIHKLTFDGDMDLRIYVEDKSGKKYSAEYSLFKVQSEKNNYKLMVANQHGTFPFNFINLNGQEFSTYDRQSKSNKDKVSCASSRGNGWWFKDCKEDWWLGSNELKLSRMMVRPKRK